MRPVASFAMWLGFWLTGMGLSGCGGTGDSCSAGATVAGTVLDVVNGGGIEGSFVVLRRGGLTAGDPNGSTYNTAFDYVIPSNDQGQYSLKAECGNYGIYGFATGYHCFPATEANGGDSRLLLQRNGGSDALPTLGDIAFTPSTAKEGGSVQISATVASTNAQDPLSSLVLLLNMQTFQVVALNPPSPGSGGAFPNGTWQRTFTVPSQSGTLNLTLVAATQACEVVMTPVTLGVEY